MSLAEINTCPRCGNNFECNTDSIQSCQCEEIEISEAQHEYMREHYTSCLCRSCLICLQQQFSAEKSLEK